MVKELEKKLKKAAELGASAADIDDIGRLCKEKAKNYPRVFQEEAYTGCVVDELDELNEELKQKR